MMDKLEQLKRLQAETPNDTFLLFAIAKEYANRGLWSESATYFDQLAAVDPDYVGMYLHWGRVWQSLDDLPQAQHIYNRGLDVANRIGDFHAKAELMAALQELMLDL
jgi:tetratricopeptide (TPR) repeat protein